MIACIARLLPTSIRARSYKGKNRYSVISGRPITALLGFGYSILAPPPSPINRWSLPPRSLNALARNQVPIRHPPNDNHWRFSLNRGAVYDGHSLSEPHFPAHIGGNFSCGLPRHEKCTRRSEYTSPLPLHLVRGPLVFHVFLSRPPFPCFFVRTSIDCFPSPSLPLG